MEFSESVKQIDRNVMNTLQEILSVPVMYGDTDMIKSYRKNVDNIEYPMASFYRKRIGKNIFKYSLSLYGIRETDLLKIVGNIFNLMSEDSDVNTKFGTMIFGDFSCDRIQEEGQYRFLRWETNFSLNL